MHRILHDYFWVYIVASIVLCGAAIYFMPKLTRFLERVLTGRQSRRAKINEPEKNAAKNKNRYKTF